MTLNEFKTSLQPFWDIGNLIKPQLDWIDSGNGVAYTCGPAVCIMSMLGEEKQVLDKLIEEKITPCFKEPGLLTRRQSPLDDHEDEAWDDFAMLFCGEMVSGHTRFARECLWYGVRHFFIFDNDGVREGSDWLGRSVHIWLFALCAAFPILKPLWFIPMWIATSLIKGDDWKVWCFHRAFSEYFGFALNELLRVDHEMPIICKKYFGSDHAFTHFFNDRAIQYAEQL